MKTNLSKCITSCAPRFILRFFVIQRLLNDLVTTSRFEFIEVGPGRGDITAYVMQKFKANGTLFEMSEAAIEFIKNRNDLLKNTLINKGRIENYKFLKSVQIIFAFEVIEHIENEKYFLEKLYKCLSQGGLLFFSVPAHPKYWTNQDEWAGHIRRYEKKDILSLMANNGFEVIEIVEYGFPLMSLLRPIKNYFYDAKFTISKEMRTKRSGLESSLFSRLPSFILLPFYWPLKIIQEMPFAEGLGDGFVVVAKRSK